MPPSRPHRGRRRELHIALVDDGREHQEVAAAAGIAPQTLSGIVTGRIRDPRAQTRAQIANALGRREEELFPEYTTADVAVEEDLAAKVRAQRMAQGLPPEPTDEQMDFIGAVVFSDLRRRPVIPGAHKTASRSPKKTAAKS